MIGSSVVLSRAVLVREDPEVKYDDFVGFIVLQV